MIELWLRLAAFVERRQGAVFLFLVAVVALLTATGL